MTLDTPPAHPRWPNRSPSSSSNPSKPRPSSSLACASSSPAAAAHSHLTGSTDPFWVVENDLIPDSDVTDLWLVVYTSNWVTIQRQPSARPPEQRRQIGRHERQADIVPACALRGRRQSFRSCHFGRRLS